MNAVEVSDVSKYYTLGNSQWTRMRRILSPVRRHDNHEVCALRDVSFSVAEGEAFGIIGANGSGKSTLLQIIAGILRPTVGSVTVHGRCSTLLELGSGFAPEFTGRQNVHLNATILGLSQDEIGEKFAAIERFAGIGDFIDQPIRTYSTGMVLRLAFAVVAHSDPRILIVDEALAVGDVAFRQRCMRRIHELRAAGVTILFVSHDTSDVKALCARCLWLEHGAVRALGESDEVVARYLAATLDRRQLPEPAADGTGNRHPSPRHRRTVTGKASLRQWRGRSDGNQPAWRAWPRGRSAQTTHPREANRGGAHRGFSGSQSKGREHLRDKFRARKSSAARAETR